MGVPSRHILKQGSTLGALSRTAWLSLQQRWAKPTASPGVPGQVIERTVSPPPRELCEDFVRHLGGDPRTYRGEIPPHLFPQWAFAAAARTLEGLPYPMLRVVNGGCRMEVRAPLPLDKPLHVKAWLENIDDDGRRAILQSRVITGTADQPEALITDFHALVPLKQGSGAQRGGTANGRAPRIKPQERPVVPDDAHEIAMWRLDRSAGLSFALLTGDFNPIHWSAGYAKASGFRNVILHGFGTFARSFEGLVRNRFAGESHTLRVLEARFTRPLVLPADVGLYVRDKEVFVGAMPGGPAYMTGHFETGGNR